MISAVILAAGESKRMGRPKMLLPWGEHTVLGQVISTYHSAGVRDVLVVTGGAREQVTAIAGQHGARSVFNGQFAGGGMLSSLQCGLRLLEAETPAAQAALIALGDQPQLRAEDVSRICHAFQQQTARLIVPSFQMRRGHPWLVERSLWEEILALQSPLSPRDFLNRHKAEILYVEADSASILADLDTPQDYQRSRPQP